ncbi:Glycosyltransferase [Cupriavidus oxalaticus]|uniref:glycosyltransferase family protein n=1 Tax=Cupriavidus oxalaticus TaxID=96344 RepID=UPI003F73FEAE
MQASTPISIANGEVSDVTSPAGNLYRVLLLDTKSSNPNHYICLAIQRALQATGMVECVVKAGLDNAVNEAIRQRCNLFFAFDGEELNPAVCARVAAVCGRSVLWVTEDPYELEVNVHNAGQFDLVFTNDSASVKSYGKKGRHLPLAGAKPFHLLPHVADASKLRYDLFFAGTAWPNRVALLKEFLNADWGEHAIRAKIALPTNEHLPPIDLGLPPSQLNWRTSPVDFARFANMSLAALVLPRVFSASGNRDFAETPPPRLFEAALSGTVQLVQSKLTEAENYFVPGEEFLYFEDAPQLIRQVAALRADIDWRNEIASRAQKKALEQHCYEHRVAYVLDELERHLASTVAQGASAAAVETQSTSATTAKRPRLMLVAHNVVRNGHFGGVEVYLELVRKSLGDQYDVFFYVPERQGDARNTVLLNAEGEVLRKFSFNEVYSPWVLSCPEREEAFTSVLSEYNISAVHFHHLLGHVPSLIEVASALGVATALTFHDYFTLCHNFTLLSFRGTYCHPDEISLSQCDVCLWNGHHILPGGQAARRAYWDGVLAICDALVFNTQGALDLASRIYPSVGAHPKAVVLPVPIEPVSRVVEATRQAGQVLKVAVLGNFTPHKGADVIARVIPLLANSNVEFHIFGRVEGQYRWLADKSEYPFVHVHGGYSPGEIPAAIRDCNVSLHLSIWPETYCLTLSEAWDLGLVPIVTDIGALGERVIDNVNGIKIAPNSEGQLVQALHRLVEMPGLLERLRAGIDTAPISHPREHFRGLADVYQPLVFHRRASSQVKEVGTLRRAQLQRPLGSPVWAVTPSAGAVVSRPTLRRRIAGLVGRAVRHYRVYGATSTARACVRYVARRI